MRMQDNMAFDHDNWYLVISVYFWQSLLLVFDIWHKKKVAQKKNGM